MTQLMPIKTLITLRPIRNSRRNCGVGATNKAISVIRSRSLNDKPVKEKVSYQQKLIALKEPLALKESSISKESD